jgi:hypothetical protein
MNWLVMLHRLLDDQGYTPTDELRSFGEAAKAGMYDPKLINREMDDRAQYVQAEIFKGLTFGNSSGDYPMFEFVTTGNRYPSMAFCLLCDDVERELGNTAKAEKCRKDCEANGWVPVSMRDDWTTIYGPDVRPAATAVRSVSRVAGSHGQTYTIGGLPATEGTRGIVVSNQRKTVRRQR